jgi:hypothetical protein
MAFRSVSKATIAFGEEFLYELKATIAFGEEFLYELRPALRAAASGGRPRAGSDATATGQPASPSTQSDPRTARRCATMRPCGETG